MNKILLIIGVVLLLESGEKADLIESSELLRENRINQIDEATLDSIVDAKLKAQSNNEDQAVKNFAEIYVPIGSFIIAILSLIVTFVTIYYGYRGLLEDKKVRVHEILGKFHDVFASNEMLEAHKRLRNWKNKNEEKFPREFKRLRKTDYSKVKVVDEARRKIHYFYFYIYQLANQKIVTTDELKIILSKGSLEFFFEVCEPLEKAVNEDYAVEIFDYYREIHKELFLPGYQKSSGTTEEQQKNQSKGFSIFRL